MELSDPSGDCFVLWLNYKLKRGRVCHRLEKELLEKLQRLKESTHKIQALAKNILSKNERSLGSGVMGFLFYAVRYYFGLWSKTFGTLLEQMKGTEIDLKTWVTAFTSLEGEHKECFEANDEYKNDRRHILDLVGNIIDDRRTLQDRQREIDRQWKRLLRKLTFGLC